MVRRTLLPHISVAPPVAERHRPTPQHAAVVVQGTHRAHIIGYFATSCKNTQVNDEQPASHVSARSDSSTNILVYSSTGTYNFTLVACYSHVPYIHTYMAKSSTRECTGMCMSARSVHRVCLSLIYRYHFTVYSSEVAKSA